MFSLLWSILKEQKSKGKRYIVSLELQAITRRMLESQPRSTLNRSSGSSTLTPEPYLMMATVQGKQANPNQTPMNHRAQPSSILELPLAISKLLFHMHLLTWAFSAGKSCVTGETSHPFHSQWPRRSTGTESGPAVTLDVVKRRGNVKPSPRKSDTNLQPNILTEKKGLQPNAPLSCI